jgi:hypothetical protein
MKFLIMQFPPTSCHFNPLWSTHLRLGLPSGLFLMAFPPISYMHSFYPPFVVHGPPISSFLTESMTYWVGLLWIWKESKLWIPTHPL